MMAKPPCASPTAARRCLSALVLCALASPTAPIWAQQPTEAATAQAFAVASSGQAEQSPLRIQTGRQQTLRLAQGIARLAVGNPAVLDAKVLRQTTGNKANAELLLTAQAPGETTLMVWPSRGGAMQTWVVQVFRPGLTLERTLRSVPEHAQALAVLRQSMPEDAVVQDNAIIDVKSNTVQVDVQVVEFKKSAMKRAGMNIFSGGANNKGFSFGVFTPGTNTTANYGITSNNAQSTALNVSASAPPLAISGSGSVNANNTLTGNGGITASVVSAMNLVMGFSKAFSGAGIGVQLGFLEGNGLARVLAQPTLLAHSGQNARFLAGGEIPIPVPGSDGNMGIEYKEFGVKLDLTPTILSNERIALKVAPEASDLDFSSGVTVGGVSVPGIRTRRADTMVELADGESFIIGGLVSRNTASNVEKVPLLGDLPVIGTFFKNLSYSQEETELVIIVTPRLVHPLPAGTDFDHLLPGARSERPNAAQVWEPFIAGALKPDAALPGFSQ